MVRMLTYNSIFSVALDKEKRDFCKNDDVKNTSGKKSVLKEIEILQECT